MQKLVVDMDSGGRVELKRLMRRELMPSMIQRLDRVLSRPEPNFCFGRAVCPIALSADQAQ